MEIFSSAHVCVRNGRCLKAVCVLCPSGRSQREFHFRTQRHRNLETQVESNLSSIQNQMVCGFPVVIFFRCVHYIRSVRVAREQQHNERQSRPARQNLRQFSQEVRDTGQSNPPSLPLMSYFLTLHRSVSCSLTSS